MAASDHSARSCDEFHRSSKKVTLRADYGCLVAVRSCLTHGSGCSQAMVDIMLSWTESLIHDFNVNRGRVVIWLVGNAIVEAICRLYTGDECIGPQDRRKGKRHELSLSDFPMTVKFDKLAIVDGIHHGGAPQPAPQPHL